jgi:glycosyltransferase involved in cell wall biosynthesis
LRVLIIHNRYQKMGGEDTVFEQESELLSLTEEVKTLTFHNLPRWKGALQFFFSIWNIFSVAKIKKAIREFNPQVIHVHNWHYAIGPLIVRTANKKEIPLVLTVHNYRLLCPSGILLYKNSLFLDSIHTSFPWKAVRKKVYRGSLIQTFWLAFIIWFHKKIGTWKLIDRIILQTEMAKDIFISSSLGTTESQFCVKPNFIKDPEPKMRERKDFFLYIGRLSEEKGIDVLLEAFRNIEKELYIGGDGPLKKKVIDTCAKNHKMHYLGMLDKHAVKEIMSQCSALVFPSLWYEGMPLTLIEAFAVGTPVIASNIGAMSSMIKGGYNGIHFAAGDSADLFEKIVYWENLSKNDKQQFSRNARSCFEEIYTPEKNKEQILSIYDSVNNKVRQ